MSVRRSIRSTYGTFEPQLHGVARLRQQVRQCHTALDEDAAAWLRKPRSPRLGLYLHALCIEDITIQSVLRERAPLFTSFWPNVDSKADVAALRKYVEAVYAATDAYLVELPSDGLSRRVDLVKLGLGRHTVGWLTRRFVVQEVARICSEIADANGSSGTERLQRGVPPNSPVLAHAGVS
jgi:hypothetical protein